MKLSSTLVMSAAVLTLSLAVPMSSRAQSSGNASLQTTAQLSAAHKVHGCGNSGKPGCPPKKCPPGHGGTNPAGKPDCKKRKSRD